MIRLVAGDTGEGKTKSLIKMANEAVNLTDGHIVYLDGDSSHMLHLKHQIRYTNISEYPITDYKEFFGFMCGILSEDNDISEIYADGLLRLAHVNDIHSSYELIDKLKTLSDKFDVRFIFSVNCDTNLLPDFMKEFIVA
ncbi:MAG: twitching motility protein PilT [Firmicutes bacterium HGW-Firmicutes-1]|jgi:hypothetical protein|nr:MAG: twitching motility protein PilT [Firmicutes bacterium HGW-Firmicutes-1]